MDTPIERSTLKSVCVDLDGTLLYYTNWKGMDGKLGRPRPGAKKFLWDIRKFAKVIIFTARLAAEHRTEETLSSIKRWLCEHELSYDEIYIGSGKPIAEAFVDDRAICVPKNPVESDFKEALTKVRRFIEDI